MMSHSQPSFVPSCPQVRKTVNSIIGRGFLPHTTLLPVTEGGHPMPPTSAALPFQRHGFMEPLLCCSLDPTGQHLKHQHFLLLWFPCGQLWSQKVSLLPGPPEPLPNGTLAKKGKSTSRHKFLRSRRNKSCSSVKTQAQGMEISPTRSAR